MKKLSNRQGRRIGQFLQLFELLGTCLLIKAFTNKIVPIRLGIFQPLITESNGTYYWKGNGARGGKMLFFFQCIITCIQCITKNGTIPGADKNELISLPSSKVPSDVQMKLIWTRQDTQNKEEFSYIQIDETKSIPILAW